MGVDHTFARIETAATSELQSARTMQKLPGSCPKLDIVGAARASGAGHSMGHSPIGCSRLLWNGTGGRTRKVKTERPGGISRASIDEQ
jgi:hypothetical protein